jgi:hypothetical protein
MTLATTNAATGRRLRVRHLWIVPGLAIAIFANLLGNANGVGILELVAFGIAPDVARFLGARARTVHNLLHQPLLAAVAVVVAATGFIGTGVVPAIGLVAALVWMSHIVIGWAVGDVPRPQDVRRDA